MSQLGFALVSNENGPVVPPRAARPHSASVGRRNFVVPKSWFTFPMKLVGLQVEPVAPPQMSFQERQYTGWL